MNFHGMSFRSFFLSMPDISKSPVALSVMTGNAFEGDKNVVLITVLKIFELNFCSGVGISE